MSDILGPADAAGAVTVRPADDRTFGSLDSWFKDCTDAETDDGTEYRASFFNGLIAAVRGVWRINGGTVADAAVKIVPETGTDDLGLAKALQHLVQRAQPNYAVAGGTANAITATLSPAPVELKPGMVARVKIAATNTAAAKLNLNGFGFIDIIHPDGAASSPRDMVLGQIAEFRFDGTAWQLLGAVNNVLTAPRTYYVNPAAGSDSNTGLDAGHAFQTIQAALSAAALFNLNGFKVTILCAPGNYTQFSTVPINGSGSIDILGDTATPANCAINGLTGAAIDVGHQGYFVAGFKLTSALSNPASPGLRSFGNGNVTIKNMEFGACNTAHMLADAGGKIGIAGASDNPTNFLRISGNAPAHAWANGGGQIINFAPILQIMNAVAFTTFAIANYGQLLAIYSSITGFGFVSGQKYQASANGILSTNAAGASYLPGTVAGATQTGGQYL